VFASFSLAVAFAVFVIGPVAVGTTVIVATRLSPDTNLLILHITTSCASVQVPWLLVTDRKFTVDGNVSVRTTLVASCGP
jgi:hypothetical protein